MSPASSLVPARPEYDSAFPLAASAPEFVGVAARPDRSLYINSIPKTPLAPRSIEARSAASVAFTPTHTQWVTIYYIEALVVFFLIGWNLKVVRTILFPAKLLTVAFHESCHAISATLTGAKVESIILDPNQGGSTRMIGGWSFVSLPAGYIGSTFIGSALIFAGFDEEASKIACIPILVDMLLIMYWARKDWFTLVNVGYMMGWMFIFFLVDHSQLLRFYILFIGVMNVMYAIWDILDDLVFQRIEASDCAHFAELYPWMPAQVWGFVWFLFAFCGLTAGVLGGLVAFKQDFAEQAAMAAQFIPTR